MRNTCATMPQENLDLVQRFFDAWSQSDLKAFLSFVDADAEFDYSELDRPYRGIYRGHEQIETFYHEASDPWREAQFEIEEPLAVGDHVVVGVTRTARAVGLEVQASATILITVREGKIVGFKPFPSRSDALRAAGLE